MASIGDRIAALRLSRGLNATELARAVGIRQPSMHAIESGKTKVPGGDVLLALARILGTTPDYILTGTSGPAPVLEAELLALWRSLDDTQRASVIGIVRSLAGIKPPPSSVPP